MFKVVVAHCVLFGGLMAIVTGTVQADQVHLLNGDRMTGNLRGFDGSTLVFETEFGDVINIPRQRIAGIDTDEVVTVEFADQNLVTGQLERTADTKMRVTGPRVEDTPDFSLADVAEIHPGIYRSPEPGLQWRGHVDIGAGHSTGNTEVSNVHVRAEAIGRSESDRLTGLAEFDWAEDEGEEAKNRTFASLKYDRFFADRWYLYALVSGERDRMKDLNLRTTVGPGIGYQIIDTATASLHVEGGPTYVYSAYDGAEDDDSMAARWALRYEQGLRLARLEPVFFHNHELIADVQEVEDTFIRSRTGVRLFLLGNRNTTAQVNIDWHNDPAPGRETTDTIYLLTLGYAW